MAVTFGALTMPAGVRAADSVTIEGSVTDGNAQKPLARARVMLTDALGLQETVETGSDGRFRFIGVAADSVVSIEATGYSPDGARCHVPSGGAARIRARVYRSFTRIPVPAACEVEPDTSDRYVIE